MFRYFILLVAFFLLTQCSNSNVNIDKINSIKVDTVKKIVVLLYDGFTMLDVVGPTQSLAMLENVEIITVAKNKGLIKSDNGLSLEANFELGQVSEAYILLIPGGLEGTIKASNDTAIINWIEKLDKKTEFTTTVCTGAWILASTNLVKNKTLATHWYGKNILKNKGVKYTDNRYFFEGKYASSAGVSAGIDLGLALVAKIAGDEYAKAVQLGLQYDPKPPFNTGNPANVDTAMLNMMTKMYDHSLMNEL